MVSLKSRIKTRFSQYVKPKFRVTKKIYSSPKLILDVGVANNSYLECKFAFPNSLYVGLDFCDIDFEMRSGDTFYKINLENIDELIALQSKFDLILVNHVLEHLKNGELVYAKLLSLLNDKGILYAEFPSVRSLGSIFNGRDYHFHEDKTHKRLYELSQLCNLTFAAGCKVIACGNVNPTIFNYFLSVPRVAYAFAKGCAWKRFLPSRIKLVDYILASRCSGVQLD